MKEKVFAGGGLYVELFIPSEQATETSIIIPKLSHGSNIVVIQSGNENLGDCDAVITQSRERSLGVRTADCAPICFSDGKTIGIAHVGWRGLSLGLVQKMLAHFDTKTLSVYIAPFLHSFEIKKDFCYEQLSQEFAKYIEEQPDKLVFNFKDAIASLLPPQAVFDPRSTATDLSFPSFRRKTNTHFTTVVSFSP